MSLKVEIIGGGQHTDSRGTLHFVNDFDMSPVRRMYMIYHPDTAVVRAWRAHKIEQRWFYVLEGSFEFKAVKIDNWESPDPDLEVEQYTLLAEQSQILHLPVGYASGFRALVPGSKVMVYADGHISDAANDDYQYPVAYFNGWK